MNSHKPSRDQYSGIPWVDVTPEQARAHPKGNLGVALWVISLYFIGVSVVKLILSVSYGGGFGVVLLNCIWPFLAGLGLILRVPWSVFMVIVSTAITAYGLMRGLQVQFTLPEGAPQPDAWQTLPYLFEMIASVGILFYLIDGDRPNLIYRHRYRQYSAGEDAADG